MNIITLVIFGVVIIPMVIAGIFLIHGKGAFLIAGYNTMSRESKAAWDEKALCRFIGWLLIGSSVGSLLMLAGIYFRIQWMIYLSVVITLVGSVGTPIYTNLAKRFHRETASGVLSQNECRAQDKSNRMAIFVIIGLTAIVLIGSGIMIYQGSQDPTITVSDDMVHIQGMFGTRIYLSDVSGVTLLDESMEEIGPGRRTADLEALARLCEEISNRTVWVKSCFTSRRELRLPYVSNAARGETCTLAFGRVEIRSSCIRCWNRS